VTVKRNGQPNNGSLRKPMKNEEKSLSNREMCMKMSIVLSLFVGFGYENVAEK